MKVLQSVFVLVLWTFSWSAFAGVYDINIAGSFDDLVATNGEYHLDGLCSKGDVYGYEISLFTENQEQLQIVESAGQSTCAFYVMRA